MAWIRAMPLPSLPLTCDGSSASSPKLSRQSLGDDFAAWLHAAERVILFGMGRKTCKGCRMRMQRSQLWCPFCHRQAWLSSWVFWALCVAGAGGVVAAMGIARHLALSP